MCCGRGQRGRRGGCGGADVVRFRVAADGARGGRVHARPHSAGESHLLDFFVAAPGRGLAEPEPAPLVPVEVAFSESSVQRFNVGPSSCGAWGTTRGLAEALDALRHRRDRRPLRAGARCPRRGRGERDPGVPARDPRPDLPHDARMRGDLRARRPAEAGRRAPATAGARGSARPARRRGPGSSTRATSVRACSEWVLERGGLVTRPTSAGYEVASATPARARFRGREVLTNPPPSSGGILIADALELLDRIDRPGDTRALAEVIASTTAPATRSSSPACATRSTLAASWRRASSTAVAREHRLPARVDDPPRR